MNRRGGEGQPRHSLPNPRPRSPPRPEPVEGAKGGPWPKLGEGSTPYFSQLLTVLYIV